MLEKMQAIQTRSIKIKGLIFNNVFYLQMLYHLVQEAYKAVIAMIPAFEAGLATYSESITKARRLTFFYNIAIAYFLEKDYSNALEWINRIFKEPKLEERQDIQSLARIFQLVIHFELDHTDFVESLILAANRYLIKKDKRASAEFLIIRHLKEALHAHKAERRRIFQQLDADLQEEKGLEEIKIWVQSKINR